MIYPVEYPVHKQNFAEQQVHQALSTLEPQDFDIFYNQTFARREPKEAALYEIDFLIFDLRGGRLNHVFVIETKGGSINYSSKKKQWSSNNIPMDKGPDEQAMGYVSNILARYNTTLVGQVTVTWLLWFPDGVKGKKHLPSHLDAWRILDQSALKTPLKFIDQAIEAQVFEKSFHGVEKEEYLDEIKPDLMQGLHVSANLKSLLDGMNISFAQIEAQQKLFFTGMLQVSKLAVEGSAGSGKSVLAKCAATELASQGKKVLLLCFNQHLKNRLGEGLSENVHVSTILTFMLDHIGKYDYAWFAGQDKRNPELFNKTIPAKFKEMLKKHPWVPEDKFDVLIIDEAQDMQQDWIKQVMRTLRGKGQMIIFHDPLQNIFNKDFALPDGDWFPFKLEYNLRNSKKINDFINQTLGTDFLSGHVPEGKDVVMKTYSKKEDLPKTLELLIMQLHKMQHIPLEEIKIIVDGSSKDWDFLEHHQDGTIPFRKLNPKLPTEPGIVYYTSVNSFKGCESDVVILVLDGPLLPVGEKDRKVRYTQMSRAKGMLWVVEKTE